MCACGVASPTASAALHDHTASDLHGASSPTPVSTEASLKAKRGRDIGLGTITHLLHHRDPSGDPLQRGRRPERESHRSRRTASGDSILVARVTAVMMSQKQLPLARGWRHLCSVTLVLCSLGFAVSFSGGASRGDGPTL